MTENPQNTDEIDNKWSLDRIVKIVLVFGIIFVSGALIVNIFKPEEEFVLFFVLNEDQELKNYPTNATIGENVSLYLYLNNSMASSEDFCVKIYQGNQNTSISSTIGVDNATYLYNITKSMFSHSVWISPQINVSFPVTGENIPIVFELWHKVDSNWVFMPDYILFIRLNITA